MHNNLNYKSKSVLVNCQKKQGKRYNRFLQRGNVLTDADAAYALIMMAMTLFDDFTSKFFGVVPGSSFFQLPLAWLFDDIRNHNNGATTKLNDIITLRRYHIVKLMLTWLTDSSVFLL